MADELTTGEFAAHFEHDLSSAAVLRLIDDAEDEINKRYGNSMSQIDYLDGGDRLLFLLRPASEVSSVVTTIGETDTTLAADDFRLRYNGAALEREVGGTNGRALWEPDVVVTYTPESDLKRRKRVIIDLVKLSIQYDGVKSSRAGDQSMVGMDYQDERERLLSSLAANHRYFA
jgi:hypothetical protein